MYRTVIVGHDGTSAADAALRLAEQLADEDARLLLARVAGGRGRGGVYFAALRAGVSNT